MVLLTGCRYQTSRRKSDAVPIYEYHCQECGEEFEELVRSAREIECPECGGEDIRKLVSRFGFSFTAEDKGEWKSGPKK